MNLEHASTEFKNTWFGELWPLMCGHPKIRQSYPDDASIELGGETYCEVLSDLPIDRLRGAVRQCLASCDWFPTPAELRRATGVLAGERLSVTLEAFGAVMRELSASLAERRKPQLDDPIAAEVIRDLGGAHTCVHMKAENLYPRFRDAYIAKTDVAREQKAVIPRARQLAGPPRAELTGSNVRAFPARAERETRELSPEESARLVREIRERQLEQITAPPAPQMAVAVEDASPETVSYRTCGDCAFEFPTTYDVCPRCRVRRATQAS